MRSHRCRQLRLYSGSQSYTLSRLRTDVRWYDFIFRRVTRGPRGKYVFIGCVPRSTCLWVDSRRGGRVVLPAGEKVDEVCYFASVDYFARDSAGLGS